MATDYQVDLRADHPPRSSRLWAVLTILLIKFLALIPHFIVLALLGIAQAVVAIVAQVIVAFTGHYPESLFTFLSGVIRWNARVGAFAASLTDRYPPFTLRSVPEYPIDVAIERPQRSSRAYAIATLIFQIVIVASIVGTAGSGDSSSSYQIDTNTPSMLGTLYLRGLAATPHWIILAVLGFAAFFVWLIVQWIILFAGRYPEGLYDFTAGVARWAVRVNAYALGLRDNYPPFSFQPSSGMRYGGPPTQHSGPWVESGWPGEPGGPGGQLPPAAPYGGAPAAAPPQAPPPVVPPASVYTYTPAPPVVSPGPTAPASSAPGQPYTPAPPVVPPSSAAQAGATAPSTSSAEPPGVAQSGPAPSQPGSSQTPPEAAADPTQILAEPPHMPPPPPPPPPAPPAPPILPPEE